MHRVLLFGFTLPSIFSLLINLTRCRTGLMMWSIHIDEFTIHVSIAARSSRLCAPFFKKLDSLLDRLDNRRTMHGSQNGALEWARGNQNDAITVVVPLFTSYKYLLCLALITISHSSFSFSLKVYLSCFLLTNNGRQEMHQARSFSL
jgi:hypothetical protein